MRGVWGGATDTHPWQVKISWKDGLSVCQTGFHLRAALAAVPTASDVLEVVSDFATESFRGILGDTMQLIGVDVVNLYSGDGDSESYPAMMGSAATGGGKEPSFMCATVTLKGELRKRYGQGRMFLPTFHENYVTGDVLSTEGVAALQGVVTQLTNRFVDNGALAIVKMINLHGVLPPKAATPSRPARPEIPASWYDVTSIRLNTTTTFLRSRKAGVGS